MTKKSLQSFKLISTKLYELHTHNVVVKCLSRKKGNNAAKKTPTENWKTIQVCLFFMLLYIINTSHRDASYQVSSQLALGFMRRSEK